MGSPFSLVAQNLLILHPPGNILNQILMLLHNKKTPFLSIVNTPVLFLL